jgi:hypothetical protein
MLPAHLAENIHKQVLFYLQSTFDFRDKAVERAFERFLTDSSVPARQPRRNHTVRLSRTVSSF